ncbi:MAG TPA: FAD-dependent oxidoreductase, partial [Chthoniobacterales bacterium]
MKRRVAVIGAGVSGLTCAVLLAEHGSQTAILAGETRSQTTSAAAGAIWFPYDVKPLDAAIRWALESYQTFDDLRNIPKTGVSMIELRTFCREGTIPIPAWASNLGGSLLQSSGHPAFSSGFTMPVPLIDTTIYLDYLASRFAAAGGSIRENVHFTSLAEVPSEFEIVVNCAGIGARALVPDNDLEPHRGQVVIVSRLDLRCAVVCDDAPLMYAIPRTNDCVFGGTNETSDNRHPDPATTKAILEECSRVLNIPPPPVLMERVGLRPFRRSGIRLEADRLGDGRTVIHNYGHGGS